MARVLGENVINELIFDDPISGSKISLYYEPPSTEMRIAYFSAIWDREGDKVKDNLIETRQSFGTKVIKGFGEGSFEKKIGDEKIPISSDPKSPHYDPDWLSFLQKYASDLIERLAIYLFERENKIIPGQRIKVSDPGSAPEGPLPRREGSLTRREEIFTEKN